MRDSLSPLRYTLKAVITQIFPQNIAFYDGKITLRVFFEKKIFLCFWAKFVLPKGLLLTKVLKSAGRLVVYAYGYNQS